MKVITVANRKGGAGKSTLAAHLSVEAEKAGLKTIIIDMDRQKSLETWWKKRKEETPFLDLCSPLELGEKIEKLSDDGFDVCIIDTPGDTSEYASSGVAVADLVVIPTKPTSTDLTAIGRTISFVKRLQKRFIFVVTQAVPSSIAGVEACLILAEFGEVVDTIITNRTCYYQAMAAGKSASELNPSAEKELHNVWSDISIKLDLKVVTDKKEVA